METTAFEEEYRTVLVWAVKTVTGLMNCPEILVRNYCCSCVNGPEERGSHPLCGGSLKSHVKKSSRCKLFPERIFTSD